MCKTIYLVEPCYIQLYISKIIRYVFIVLNTVGAHMYSKFGTNSPDIEGLAATWTLWWCQNLANLARFYTLYHRSPSFVNQNAGMKITNVWVCLRLCNIQDTCKYVFNGTICSRLNFVVPLKSRCYWKLVLCTSIFHSRVKVAFLMTINYIKIDRLTMMIK